MPLGTSFLSSYSALVPGYLLVRIGGVIANIQSVALFRRILYYTPLPYNFDCLPMSHITHNKSKLLGRVRRIRGQVEALERALDTDKGCAEVLHQIAAVRGATNGLMAEVMEDHMQMHVANPSITSDAERNKGANELMDVIRTYLK